VHLSKGLVKSPLTGGISLIFQFFLELFSYTAIFFLTFIQHLGLVVNNHSASQLFKAFLNTVNIQQPEARSPETFENRTYLCPNMKWSVILFLPFNNRSRYQMVAKLDLFIIKNCLGLFYSLA
jgi:hypothetical protein